MKPLRFAPLVRVSDKKQKKGESLATQRTQLDGIIRNLGGKIYHWYAGQEHATPDQERKILEQLMADAQAKKFDAVMVADISRWSRDNEKNKAYLRILRNSETRFFVGNQELDLFNPEQTMILGMGVEIGEFFASQQAYKSIINRIARAERGYPSGGNKPYGRTFNKVTEQWTIDPAAQEQLEAVAHAYLNEDCSLLDLGKRFGIAHCTLRHRLLEAGDQWVQTFRSKQFAIDRKIETIVPRLLPAATIQKIKQKAQANRTWKDGHKLYEYLLSRMIFHAETGFALTGACKVKVNKKGKVTKIRAYRAYVGTRYHVSADKIENAVIDDIFEWLGSEKKFRQAIFEGHAVGKVADDLGQKKQAHTKELSAIKKRISNLTSAIEGYNSGGLEGFLEGLRPKLKGLEDRAKDITFKIQTIDNQLATLPSEEEIKDRQQWIKSRLLLRIKESWATSRAAFDALPFADKRKFLALILGGRDESGRRCGVYVSIAGERWGKKAIHYEIRGRLGNIEGWIGEAGEIIADNTPSLRSKSHLTGQFPPSSRPSPRTPFPFG